MYRFYGLQIDKQDAFIRMHVTYYRRGLQTNNIEDGRASKSSTQKMMMMTII